MRSKADRIIDLSVESKNSFSHDKGKWLASAFYVSAMGTKHFYESLEFLSEVYPEQYLKEFELFKSIIS